MTIRSYFSKKSPISLVKFIYSEYFTAGVRRAVGTVAPVIFLMMFSGKLEYGVIATMGALGVSILDQPGPVQHRFTEMLVCALFNGFIVWLTAYHSQVPILLFFQTITIVFFASMLSVYGKLGAMMGSAILLLLTITLQSHVTPDKALQYAIVTLIGGIWYCLFATLTNQVNSHSQEKRIISVNLYLLSSFLRAKTQLYDPKRRLESSYTNVFQKNTALVESQDIVRSIILRPLGYYWTAREQQRRQRLINIFVLAVDMHENALTNQTDHQELLNTFKDTPIPEAIQTVIYALAKEIDTVALALATNTRPKHSDHLHQAQIVLIHLIEDWMQAYPGSRGEAILDRLYQRLDKACSIIEQMKSNTYAPNHLIEPILEANHELKRFISRDPLKLEIFRRNLSPRSPIFRFALRMCIATTIAWEVTHFIVSEYYGHHSYWILLTIFMIMKPSYGLSFNRNIARLIGTAIGGGLIILILPQVNLPEVTMGIMFIAAILSNTFTTTNYALSSVFNTMFALLSLHLLTPEPLFVVGERLLDTAIGSGIALACGFIFPFWESNRIKDLFKNALKAQNKLIEQILNTKEGFLADIEYRLQRKQAVTAITLFTASYYRMLQDPKRAQIDIIPYNDLVLDIHHLNTHLLALIQDIRQGHKLDEPTKQGLRIAQKYISDTLAPSQDVTNEDIFLVLNDEVELILNTTEKLYRHAKRLKPINN